MRRKIVPVLLILFAALISTAAAAENQPITIEGADTARWDMKQQLLYASGSVVISVDGLVLKGEQLVWDLNNQELYLEGSVLMEQGEAYLEGESLVYNVVDAKGEFVSPRTQLVSEKVKGPIFVFGDRVHIDSETYFMHDGVLSTCDMSEPHYHLAVSELEIYPGDKMVIRGVRFYEGKLPLFYWPYLVIPLDDEEFDFTLPEIGYNSSDGYYIKNRYNYYISENASGSLLYDYYTRKGLGLGVNHNYRHDLLGDGTAAFYALPFAASKYLMAQVQHKYSGDNFTLSTSNAYLREYQNAVLKQDSSSSTSFSYQTEAMRLNGSFNYRLDQKGEEKSSTWTASGSWRYQLNPSWDINANSNITAKDDTKTRNHLVETSYRYQNHRFNLAVEQKYNPDLLDELKKPAWSSINRMPEFTWQWYNPSLAGAAWPGQFQVSQGRFSEYPADVTAWRIAPAVELFTQSWRSDFGTTLTYGGNLTGYFYDTNQSQQSVYGRFGLTQQLTDTTRVTANYQKRLVWGETPFKFDKLNEQDQLTGTFRYSKQPITLTVSSGYNFLNQRFNNLRTQLNYSGSGQPVTASLAVNYDLNNRRFGELSGSINYRPQTDWVFNVGAVYNIHSQSLKRVNGKIVFDLTETLKLSYDVVYEPEKTQKLSTGKLVLTLDLHCRELVMSYDQVREEFKVQYSIKAFPKLPIEISSKEGISFFELEDLKDAFGSN